MLPYVDNATFENAPTGIDTNLLVPGGDDAAQQAELTNILERASSDIDTWCRQRLAATTDSDEVRIKPNKQGQLELYPRNFPVIAVLSARWIDLSAGISSSWVTVDLAGVMPLERALLIYDKNYSRYRGLGRPPLIVQYQYTNGYAHTQLADDAEVDASMITVDSTIGIGTAAAGPAGWNVDADLLILDGSARENVTVTAINGNVLTLAAPLQNAHTAGALITAVPAIVQEKTIEVAAGLVKKRGDGSLEMPDRTAEPAKETMLPGSSGLDNVLESLWPFRRVL